MDEIWHKRREQLEEVARKAIKAVFDHNPLAAAFTMPLDGESSVEVKKVYGPPAEQDRAQPGPISVS